MISRVLSSSGNWSRAFYSGLACFFSFLTVVFINGYYEKLIEPDMASDFSGRFVVFLFVPTVLACIILLVSAVVGALLNNYVLVGWLVSIVRLPVQVWVVCSSLFWMSATFPVEPLFILGSVTYGLTAWLMIYQDITMHRAYRTQRK